MLKKPLNDSETANPRVTPKIMLTRRIDILSNRTNRITWFGLAPIACNIASYLFLWLKTRERNTKAEDIEAKAATTNIMLSKPGVPNIKPPLRSFCS